MAGGKGWGGVRALVTWGQPGIVTSVPCAHPVPRDVGTKWGWRAGFGDGDGSGAGARWSFPSSCPCPSAQGGDGRVLPLHQPGEPASGTALHDAQPLRGQGQAASHGALPQPPDPRQRDLPVHPRLPPLLQRECPWDGAGPGRAAGVGDAGAVWCGEREGARLGVVLPGKAKFGNEAGGKKTTTTTCRRTPRGAAPPPGISTAPTPGCRNPFVLGGWGGRCRGSRPRSQPALCLQEKEIMKELLENGPVQGRERPGHPRSRLLQRLGGTGWEQDPPLGCSPRLMFIRCPGSVVLPRAPGCPSRCPPPPGTCCSLTPEI